MKALTQQLDALQKLKNWNYQEAKADEAEWEHFTESIIAAAFGDPSISLNNFYAARHVGGLQLGQISSQQHQINFESRLTQFEALLKSLVSTLRLQLPEEEIKGVYEPGEEYAFYRDLTSLIESATQDIFIVDAYLGESV